jgi:hypothetical protein
MAVSSLTDADLEAIERRLEQSRMAAAMPKNLPLMGWEKEMFETQDAKRLERLAADRAEQERQQRIQQCVRERKAREFEANAPARAKAQADLEKLNAEIARVDAERDRLLDRQIDLEQVASR